MPIQKYQCQTCGLSVRKRKPAHISEIKCECGEVAYSDNSSSMSVGFSTSSINKTMKTQETGIESLDLDFDRVIGEDARAKWETIYQRRRDKWDIINNQNVSGKEILRMKDGSYEAMPQISTEIRTSRISAMDTIKTDNQQIDS